jgi:glycosyltransferase involved in cell wall biosynthesis/predicted O-methyltransferase YrrM
MIHSFSVIVPVLNQEDEIVQTLESIEASIAYFYAHHGKADHVAAEVILVNEGSSDRTVERVTEFCRDKPYYTIIHHFKSLGAGTARNTGVKVSKGDILFFCDGDDLYYREHIYLCFQILNYPWQLPSDRQPISLQLETERGTHTIQVPQRSIGVVRTGAYTQDPLHPYWKHAVENSIPLNLCIRRDCHEFIEGFPEAPIYKKTGCEDIAYQLYIAKFFHIFKLELDTVEYVRYPGNNLDRQLKKFQTPPEHYQDDLSSEQKQLHAIRGKLEQEKIVYLLDKFRRMEQDSTFLDVLNWQPLANEYMAQQQYPEAIRLYEQGMELEPETADAVKNLLAAAYNNLGSALRSQGNLPQAVQLFQKELAIHPTLSNNDLAKLHYNVAATFKDEGEFEQASIFLHNVLQLDPTFSQTLPEFPRTLYQVEVLAKGYQFTQDWFSINLPVWQQYLQRFVNMPDLRALEIGSWEGRSTCWLIDHILTHPSARISCIDTFEGSVEHRITCDQIIVETIEKRFNFNITKTGHLEKVRTIVGKSQTVLRSLIPNSYHFVYIDGSHVASDVLEDALLSWGLVKCGGMMIFDDYGFSFPQGIDENPPRVAIDAFMTVFATKISVLHRGYQVLLEKIAD